MLVFVITDRRLKERPQAQPFEGHVKMLSAKGALCSIISPLNGICQDKKGGPSRLCIVSEIILRRKTRSKIVKKILTYTKKCRGLG